MVLLDNNLSEPDSPIQYYYGDCDSLLANCCTKTNLSSPLKFRTMNRQRRQKAFEALRQMKLQQSTDTFSTRSRGRRNRKRFYRALCCTDLHISESQSSVYSTTMATAKSRSYIPTTSGLTNELYFASHKPDGDNEKTPPALLRNKPHSSHLQIIPIDNIQTKLNNRRPISSPVRSTTYVLQQHHRTNNSVTNNKKISSPVHQHRPPSLTTPMTLNKTRETTQQQRTNSNHERLPIQPASVVDSTTANQQFTSRAHTTVLTPRRTSPIVKNTPTKTTTAYISRSPRIPHTSLVRPSRPPHTVVTTPIQQRSPRVQIRSSNLTPASQRTISSSPTTNKSNRPQYAVSKSPEKLRSVTGIVTRLRPAHTIVNKSKPDNSNTPTNHLKSRTPNTVRTVSSSVATPRVSDLDALMAEKYINNNKTPPSVQLKSTILFPTPIVNNIRRSLFSTDSVKVVRPVRSQELKLFSCHLTPDTSTHAAASDEISYESNIDEKVSILTSTPPLEQIADHKTFDNQSIAKIDEPSSIATAFTITHDLSEDSLNEHYHIKKLLNGNSLGATVNNDSVHNSSSNEEILASSSVTSWSRIRSSCESNVSHIAPLKSETSTSPALYNGPIRQEDIHMVDDGRYFLLIDDNLSSEGSELNKTGSSSLSRSLSPLMNTTMPLKQEKSAIHRLVFPPRLGRILFYRRVLSDSDIYQKLCSKDNEINHNVYHLDTIRDYSMEFYMLTTYGSDSQLRAWLDTNYDDIGNNACYFDNNRFASLDDDDDDDDESDDSSKMKIASSSESIMRDDDLNRLQADEELDWYSELESFNLSPTNPQWKHENASSCSSEDHVGELLRAEQFSVSSLTTTTSAESSSSAGLISSSWPLTNGIHHCVHSHLSSQSLNSAPLPNLDDQSHTILKEILTYPWTHEISSSNANHQETGNDQTDNSTLPSIIHDQFQPDFYYLCPLKNTTSFLKTDEKSNGIPRQLSHDV
ncbi:unnamed protein product [Rotaria socialis]|uniref:Uncharacterized protein n=1 Tax=Rotaria socialis TaxID=392032 RepID=A0A818VNZ5_9BILA|nr:unnamed protein product [Rotaria socialis]CAF3411666.1 unnamed protein product [Rotaria socialis]CAF3713534.1 unnamed protein product [Rotaria socialis]CAF4133515.1 unnamed protein product [Rotaria socialis]CAF4814187.1 unnamed protein product [Rotaria socialis]